MKNQKDIELYNAIIVILKNIQVNTNTLSDKNMQDQKIGKSAERWAIIGTNDSVETQNRIENINNTKNFVPTLYRWNKNNQLSNPNLIESNKNVNFQNQADNIICQLDNSFLKYIKSDKVIKLIEQDYLNLRKIIRMINETNSEHDFPESRIKKNNFLMVLQFIFIHEANEKYKELFSKIIQLFSDLA